MLVDRRLAARLTAALLTLPGLESQADVSGSSPSKAVAAVAGGFLIPAEQYTSYAGALSDAGCAAALYADKSTLSAPNPLDVGAAMLLEETDSVAQKRGVPPSAPLVLLGHSRGCKTCVVAAAKSKRKVAALVLIDPVDATGPDPISVLPELSKLRVPTLVLGSGKSALDCAPTGANYKDFADALRSSGAPRLVGLLDRAGHTQFVDNRKVLSVDVCTTGKDKDGQIREVALEASAAWVRAALSREEGALRRCADTLRTQEFAAAVQWLDVSSA